MFSSPPGIRVDVPDSLLLPPSPREAAAGDPRETADEREFPRLCCADNERVCRTNAARRIG